jgi:poly-beta-1,6-N-acetyl-D-glucosamine synthase
MTYIFDLLRSDAAALFFLLLFLGASIVQFVLLNTVFARFARFVPAPAVPVSFPPVSVVVCARNEARNLPQSIPALLAQDYPGPWELIVVDDASEDGSTAWLEHFAQTAPAHFRYVLIPEKTSAGKKNALTQGIAAARHGLVALTDADCLPASRHWLSRLVAAKGAQQEIVLGYAPMTDGNGLLHAWSRYEVAHTATLYFGFALLGHPYMGVGRNLLWEKDLFRQVGGFQTHEGLASGDDDLFINQVATGRNVAVCVAPESFVYSRPAPTWRAWFVQKRRHLSASIRYRFAHQLALAAVGASWPFYYFFGILLLFLYKFAWVVGIVYTLRLFLLLILQNRIFRLIAEKGLLYYVPLLDGFLAIYYGAFVPLNLLFGRRVAWQRN